MPEKPIVTRFAPSPTGELHIGGARTALFSWAYARRHGGQFILRIEDTDRARSSELSMRRILADLKWLGMDWDQGPDLVASGGGEVDPVTAAVETKGERGPYFQSQRQELYQEYLQRLREAGRTIDENGAVRFRMPERDIVVEDQVLGPVTFAASQLEDFIIFKSDGGPTFHFANVVDDATMGVTLVIRGQEHLNNTPKHIALFEALGIEPPGYAHIPLIFNADGSKMSKRDKAKAARQAAKKAIEIEGRDAFIARVMERLPKYSSDSDAESGSVNESTLTEFLNGDSDDILNAATIAMRLDIILPEINVADFRDSGYLPQVLCNYVALLGWSPPPDPQTGEKIERFGSDPLAFIKEHFSLDRIGKSNARFDRDKLFRFNAEALAEMPFDAFCGLLAEHGQRRHPAFIKKLGGETSEAFKLFAQAYQVRSRTLDEPFHLGAFAVKADEALEYDEKAVQKVLQKNEGEGLAMLRALQPRLEAIKSWTGPAIDGAIKELAEARNINMGKIAQPVRVAVSGGTVSPPIDATLLILGKTSTLARIERCLGLYSPLLGPEPRAERLRLIFVRRCLWWGIASARRFFERLKKSIVGILERICL
jgi:glutamyl-tRNA synthetase